jgi:8-oxo-dGTP diphosphatase
MEAAVEIMGDEVASRPLRPLVVVTVATLCIMGGKLLTLAGSSAGAHPENGEWQLPNSLPHEGISLEEAARAAVAPWIAGGATHVEQLHTWNSAGERSSEPRLEVAYLALATPAAPARPARSTPSQPQWRAVDELPPLSATNLRILDRARERLRDRLNYTNLACRLLPHEFSLSELQQVYEAVQGKELDKRNFRKWVLANGVVEPTPRYRRDGAHRPARLYRPANLEISPLG